MYQIKLSGCQHLILELLYLHITVLYIQILHVNARCKRGPSSLINFIPSVQYFLFDKDDVTT